MVKRPDRSVRAERQLRRDYEARQAVHAEQLRRRRRDNWLGILLAVVVCGGAILAQLAYFGWGPGAPAPSPTPTASATPSAPPAATPTPGGEATPGSEATPLAVPAPALAEGRDWTGTMTVGGVELGIRFDGAKAPQATAVMVQAAEAGWYEGKYCPRVTSYDSMQVLQCGTADPGSTASEGGFRFGPIENAPSDDAYPAGTIAMARVSGDGSSMAHQFFIVTADSTIPSDSAGGYTVVGQVTSGLAELVSAVTSKGTADGGQDGPPAQPVAITDFSIQ